MKGYSGGFLRSFSSFDDTFGCAHSWVAFPLLVVDAHFWFVDWTDSSRVWNVSTEHSSWRNVSAANGLWAILCDDDFSLFCLQTAHNTRYESLFACKCLCLFAQQTLATLQQSNNLIVRHKTTKPQNHNRNKIISSVVFVAKSSEWAVIGEATSRDGKTILHSHSFRCLQQCDKLQIPFSKTNWC